jgi:hypothetical protein
MLAMADKRGRVWASIPGLANRARVPVEAAQQAIDHFLSPDLYSRTKDNEGRRVEVTARLRSGLEVSKVSKSQPPSAKISQPVSPLQKQKQKQRYRQQVQTKGFRNSLTCNYIVK